MSTIENKGWTVKGALSVLNMAPFPGGDTVFIPDYQTIRSAEEFLKNPPKELKPEHKDNEGNLFKI